ncbi:hybrid sensor histidine kinase/response regulator [Zoogloea dura]|jgi:two-component system sensor histidine kinase/response regulator|uniref:Sensory/regulatory protein RpfC n=1 Tax=Zoogloea dura TaxID=2728840 RepID=A0A848FY80_9RHOO|nr:response regulator [Zoogloea dura]NML24897.1 response regulator [Zoogloea dura]
MRGLQHLAGRLGLHTLGQQLTLLFALLLTVSIGAYSGYVSYEQTNYVERLERRHADEIARHLAAALEAQLASGNKAGITAHLLGLSDEARILRLTVTDRQGYPLVDLSRSDNTQPLTPVKVSDTPLPLPDQSRKAANSATRSGLETLVSWTGIGERAPLGWLRTEVQPAAASSNLTHILEDSAFAGLLTLLLGTAAIRVFLRPPLRSLEQATAFAESLEGSQGSTLNESTAVVEIRKLVDALNWTSIRLFDGQSALAASESRNRAIAEAALDSIITVDQQGCILEFNPAAERTFGLARANALHQPVTQLIFPERLRADHQAKLQELLTTPEPDTLSRRIETLAIRGNGDEFPVEMALVPLEGEGHRFITAYLRDISERKEAERIMREAKESAEANSRSKSDFLANMSHEIRTPMNAILGMTDLALETRLDEEQKEYLTLVKTSADSLLNIINDILDFSKIEAGKLDFEHIDFSLRDCVALSVRTLQQRAAEKDLELSVTVAPDVPDSLIGDPHRLRQILINLLSNGIKFTSLGSVRLSVASGAPCNQGMELRFEVTDTGVGIPHDKQGLIFEAFSQADTSTTRRYGGTGLGLTICARLVQAMGGQLGVTSMPGKGSTFHFTARFDKGQAVAQADDGPQLEGLPVLIAVDNPADRSMLTELLTQWRMAPVPAIDASQCRRALGEAAALGKPYQVAIIGTQLSDAEGFELAAAIPHLTHPVPSVIMLAGEGRRGDGARCRELGIAAYLPMPIEASDLLNAILLSVELPEASSNDRPLITRHTLREQRRQLKILLAEDNVVNQTLATRLLQKLGHQVEVANNGQEALDLHAQGHFDVILMDVQMPVMGGFDATAAIRAREAAGTPSTPIIAMTAHAMKGDRERCLQAGMDGYLSKPVHAPDLVEVLIHHAGLGDPAPTPEPESAPPSGPVFDREKVLANLGDDEELLEQLLDMYCEDEPRMLANVEAAVTEGDAEGLHSSAHALKGAVSNFCATRAQAKAQQLERAGRERNMGSTPALLDELRAELLALRQAFGRAA